MIPIKGFPFHAKPINVPKTGSPAMNWAVPSIGSKTHTNSDSVL